MCRSRSPGIQTRGSRSAFSSLASITASTLSDFKRAAAIALVSFGWESTTSCPSRRAVSTNHHQEPIDSTAMVVPAGSRLRAPSTVVRSFGNRACDGGCPSRSNASWVTRLCKSAPATCSMRGLLCEVSSLLYDKPTCEATTFVYRIISTKEEKDGYQQKPTQER